jgi:hypothetical protein
MTKASLAPFLACILSCGLAYAAGRAAEIAPAGSLGAAAAGGEPSSHLSISGVYPHLAVFSGNPEVGIGAVADWADRLWFITYPPHMRTGSSDKLYEVGANMNVRIRPESVGGTHACRLVHRESNQLIIGPYFIDAKGNVRAADLKKLVGRMTAVARHLSDPANKVYFYDMEGTVYEVNVRSLEVTKLFDKPVPGWHGKGAYTAQGRLVLANNGESSAGSHAAFKFLVGDVAKGPDEAGVLAEWDGKTWRIVERKQFCDVTGPGGIYGAPDDASPLWAIGWDRRSVILKLLDGGAWHTLRLPKASHAYDPKHGWYTEWPRIREVAPGKLMMAMHGMLYDFPQGFRAGRTGGLLPIASHLRNIPDFCHWNGRLVLATDETSIMQNPMAGQAQSNLWFGRWADLPTFGPRSGWGGPWVQDPVKAGQPSDPFLIRGFEKRVLHLAHQADAEVTFTLEIDAAGDGQWRQYQSVPVPPKGYRFHVFPKDLDAAWIRLTADQDAAATAYFHFASPRDASHDDPAMFAALAKAADAAHLVDGLIRPAKHDPNLQFVAMAVDAAGAASDAGYWEVDQAIGFSRPADGRTDEVRQVAAVAPQFEVDAASVIMTHGGKRYRLPKGDARYDSPPAAARPRAIRECQSERFLVNAHGTFYEMPREGGPPLLKPVCTHRRQVMDFCTWRGLLVLSGTLAGAKADGHYFASADGKVGLWFGAIDDLWKLGKPVGKGGPWLSTPVKAGEPSDPYLMTGYDAKRLELAHDAAEEVVFTIEVDVDHRQWLPYQTFRAAPGKTVSHTFPDGFSAHWVRVKASRGCKATAVLTYE